MNRRTPPPNYDYTATKRNAARRARSAARLDVTLSMEEAAALAWIAEGTEETAAVIVRRLILEEAQRRGAPIPTRG